MAMARIELRDLPFAIQRSEKLVVSGRSALADVPKFRGELYRKQRAIIQSMIAEENQPISNITSRSKADLIIENGFLTEPFSYGKTVTLLGLICSDNVPPCTKKWRHAFSYSANRVFNNPTSHVYEVEFSNFIHSTLVLLNRPSIVEWEKNILKFSDKTYTIIQDKKGLKKFQAMIENDDLSELGEIVLMKVGKVANYKFDRVGSVPDLELDRITNVMAMLCEGRLWDRIIVDDFDHIGFHSSDSLLNARFSWYASATRKPNNSNLVDGKFTFLDDMWRTIYDKRIFVMTKIAMLGDERHDGLATLSAIKVKESDFAQLEGTAIRYKQYIIKGGKGYDMLASLGVTEREIEEFQLDPKNVNEIILELIDRNLAEIRISTRVESVFDEMRIGAKSSYDSAGTLIASVVNLVRSAENKGRDDEQKTFQQWLKRHAVTPDVLGGARKTLRERKEQLLANLDRFRNNIKEGECQICCVPAGEVDIFYITSCCQTIICKECLKHTIHRRKPHRNENEHETVCCPNCTRSIAIDSMLCIDVRSDDFDNIVTVADQIVDQKDTVKVVEQIEQKLAEDMIQKISEATEEIIAGQSALPEKKLDDKTADLLEFVSEMMAEIDETKTVNKIDMLVKLIREGNIGNTHEIHEIKETQFRIPGLLETTSDVPRTNQPRKWLVFMIQNSSTSIVVRRLAEIGIFAVSATGTVDQIKNAINLYESSEIESVLALSAEKSSAGLNLQQTTDVVFMQALARAETIAQSIARAHRTGRTCNLTVHWIVYGHEYVDLESKFRAAENAAPLAPLRPAPLAPAPLQPALVPQAQPAAGGHLRLRVRELLAQIMQQMPEMPMNEVRQRIVEMMGGDPLVGDDFDAADV